MSVNPHAVIRPRRRPRATRLAAALLLCVGCASHGAGAPRGYVFAWPFVDPETMVPRGGTTRGAPVELDRAPGTAWEQLHQPGLEARERDRRAILALAGDYRTSFDFLETVVTEPGAGPARPYRSWATERIRVIDAREDFVSLQHVLVMFVLDDDGERIGPIVQKHWRQDWRYQPAQALDFLGFRTWRQRPLSRDERTRAWSQTVYQVDDSPRYAAVGRWQHGPATSVWQSDVAWRPLPRREHSARDDYDVLDGSHRISVLATGWVHEQESAKLVVDRATRRPVTTLAREVGVNRYERIVGFDFSAGDAYWQATAPFWQIVRDGWARRVADPAGVVVAAHCGDEPAFAPLLHFADRLAAGETLPASAQRDEVERVLDCLVTAAGEARAGD